MNKRIHTVIPNHYGYGVRKDEEPYAYLIPPGGNWRSLPIEDQKRFMKGSWGNGGGNSYQLRRMDWDEPAATITTAIMGKATCQLHPGYDFEGRQELIHNHFGHLFDNVNFNWTYEKANRQASWDKPGATVGGHVRNEGIHPGEKSWEGEPFVYDATPQQPKNGYTVAELFAGGGLMAVGMKTAGFRLVWANDFLNPQCEAYRYNIGEHIVHGDITDKAIQDTMPDVDIIAGGPPCQDYSVAGQGAGEAGERGKLVWTYLDIIQRKKPKAFIFENVKGLVGKKHKHTFRALCAKFDEIGYNVSHKVINAWDYGVAQKRERLFIVGIRKDLGFWFVFPEPLPGDYRTQVLRDVIGDLPEPEQDGVGSNIKKAEHKADMGEPGRTVTAQFRCQTHDIQNHDPKELSDQGLDYLKRDPRHLQKHRPPEMNEPSLTLPSNLKKGVPYGLFYPDNHKNIKNDPSVRTLGTYNGADPKYSVQDWGSPCATVTTRGAISGDGVSVPSKDTRKPRRFTVRECLRIQSAPDWYVLPETISLSKMYEIVGNGVPCRVAWYLGIALAKQLKDAETGVTNTIYEQGYLF